jgi:transcriptional regulator with XRE-family HTH domain
MSPSSRKGWVSRVLSAARRTGLDEHIAGIPSARTGSTGPSTDVAPKQETITESDLQQLRLLAGRSIEDVAAHLGVHRAYVMMWESGARRLPHERIADLANLYKVSVQEIADAAGRARQDRDQGSSHQSTGPVGEAPTAPVSRTPIAIAVPDASTPLKEAQATQGSTGQSDATLLSLRAATGLTHPQVASRLGFSPAQVYLWEMGKTRPDAQQVAALSTFYGVSVAELGELLDRQHGTTVDTGDMHREPGLTLKSLRLRMGLTQQQLAHAVGAPGQAIVSRWENGRGAPNEKYWDALCAVLDCSRSDLGVATLGSAVSPGGPRPGHTPRRRGNEASCPPAPVPVERLAEFAAASPGKGPQESSPLPTTGGAGAHLRQLRINAGLTTRDVAEHLGFKFDGYVIAWEAGTAKPKGPNVRSLSVLYGVSEHALLRVVGGDAQDYADSHSADDGSRGDSGSALTNRTAPAKGGLSGHHSLRDLRLRLGLSQREVSERLGHRHQVTLSMWERGQAAVPEDEVEALAAALHVQETAVRLGAPAGVRPRRVAAARLRSPKSRDPKNWASAEDLAAHHIARLKELIDPDGDL